MRGARGGGSPKYLLFAVVGGAVLGFAIFVLSGFLLPDEQATELVVAVGVALALGVGLRFLLNPKEREFGPVASSPRVEVSEQDKAAWRAMVEEGAAPKPESQGQIDEDVQAELWEYRQRARGLWAARLASGCAGLLVCETPASRVGRFVSTDLFRMA